MNAANLQGLKVIDEGFLLFTKEKLEDRISENYLTKAQKQKIQEIINHNQTSPEERLLETITLLFSEYASPAASTDLLTEQKIKGMAGLEIGCKIIYEDYNYQLSLEIAKKIQVIPPLKANLLFAGFNHCLKKGFVDLAIVFQNEFLNQ